MAVASVARALPRPAAAPSASSRALWRRLPYESAALFVLTFAGCITMAAYIVLHLHHIDGDAYSRVANAYYVVNSRDPHFAAIGFVWPPLPTILDIPLLLFKGWFPELATMGFAGSIEAAAFTAATVVVLNGAYRRAGLFAGVRLLLALAWITNPMILLYSTMGMSEAMFAFFAIAAVLRFHLWTQRRSAIDLAVAGALAGLGTLVRWEMVLVAALIALGVVMCSVRARVSRAETECNLLLYGLPVAFLFGTWIITTAVIEHDALFAFHSAYGNVQQAAVTNGFGAGQLPELKTWHGAVTYVAREAFSLYPVVVPIAGLLGARLLSMRDRVPTLIVLALGFPILAFDVYSLHGGTLALVIRYQLFVIPYAFVVAAVLIADVARTSRLGVHGMGLAAVVLLGSSNVLTLAAIANPDLAVMEAPAVTAVIQNRTEESILGSSAFRDGSDVARRVATIDRDHGLVLVDTFRANPVLLNAPDPRMYVITSDEDFEASVAAPAVYHVEYILVPKPGDEGSLDYINRQYPDLWSNGASMATLVADLGTRDEWRLYRVNPTS